MNKRPQAAFSLAEVLFSILLTGISVLSLITVLIGGMRLLENSQEVSEATGVGREQMEAIVAHKYTGSLPSSAVWDGRAGDPPTAGGFPPAPYPGRQQKFLYQTRVQVSAIDAQRSCVSVQVFWNRQSSLQLTTVVRR